MKQNIMKVGVVDGLHVIKEYLLTKGEQIVLDDRIRFKPLIDFGLITYSQKVNTTTRMAMKFDLERFFMRANMGIWSNAEMTHVKVPKYIYDEVRAVNEKYRTPNP